MIHPDSMADNRTEAMFCGGRLSSCRDLVSGNEGIKNSYIDRSQARRFPRILERGGDKTRTLDNEKSAYPRPHTWGKAPTRTTRSAWY